MVRKRLIPGQYERKDKQKNPLSEEVYSFIVAITNTIFERYWSQNSSMLCTLFFAWVCLTQTDVTNPLHELQKNPTQVFEAKSFILNLQ